MSLFAVCYNKLPLDRNISEWDLNMEAFILVSISEREGFDVDVSYVEANINQVEIRKCKDNRLSFYWRRQYVFDLII